MNEIEGMSNAYFQLPCSRISTFGKIISALALLSCLTGCIPTQQQDIATYRKVIDGGKPSTVTIAPDKVLTLTDALELAVQNEEQLSIQGENYLQALAAKDEAFSAFLPNLSIGGSWNYQNGGGVSPHHSQIFAADLPVDWNLFNGFRDYYTVKAAGETIDQQRQLIYDLKQTVLLDVAQAYYQVLTAEQSVDVLTNSLAAQEANVATLHEQFNVGAARKLDVAQAESQASQTRVQLLQSQADVKTGRALLAFLVNSPIRENPLRDDFEAPRDEGDLDGWIAEGEAGRQDLAAANAEVRAERDKVEVVFGQYYPSLSFNFSHAIYQRPFQPFTFWSAILDLNMPIYTGGRIEAQVRQAWSLYRSAALTESQLRRQIDQTVRTAYINFDLAKKELAELEVQVVAAREQYDLAVLLFKNGGGTYLNVQQAQATLLSAQLQLTTEQFNQKTAYFNLLRTVGNLSYTSVRSATRPSQPQITQLATQPTTTLSNRPTTQP
jgi:outer membrane protein